MQIPARPPVGHLIAYEYLWLSQSDERDDGAKTYPTAIIVASDIAGPTTLGYALAISHSPPRDDQRAIEVPAKLKRHLGLDDEQSWIYTSELNVFAWPGPDLRPADRLSALPSAQGTCVIGALPTDWFETVKEHLAESRRLGMLKSVKRS